MNYFCQAYLEVYANVGVLKVFLCAILVLILEGFWSRNFVKMLYIF